MTYFPDVPVEERIIQVLRHLGIEKAHFAAKVPRDWTGLAANYPEVVASLILVCPRGIAPSIARPLESRLLVIVGDRGNQAQGVRQSLADLPGAEVVVLQDYLNVSWADAVADQGEEIVTALTDFLSRHTMGKGTSGLSPNEGEIAGVSYRIQGSGPPLFLLPMGLAPSQWDPVLDLLTQTFTTILVRGPHLGMIPQLESRLSGGYATLRRNLLDEIDLRPSETILDVGCGSGVHDRAIVRRTNGANAITAVDINRYLLGEARFLAEKEGINSTIEFRAGDAESLPFDDDNFDVTISITVIEEVDADKMLAEMVRVTKPGGRVGIVARSVDLPSIINLPLSPKLKAKLEAPGVRQQLL